MGLLHRAHIHIAVTVMVAYMSRQGEVEIGLSNARTTYMYRSAVIYGESSQL